LFPSAKIAFYIPFLVSLIVSIYSYFEALNVRPEYIAIYSQKIPENIGKIRIAQISDVHVGLIVREDRIKKILNIVKDNNPDLLVSTGDFVDGQAAVMDGITELFKEINPRYGKYAIMGNHEYYVGINYSINFIEKAGFQILRNRSVNIANLTYITGIDDLVVRKDDSIEKSCYQIFHTRNLHYY